MNLAIPFRSNTEDNNHCVQASLAMILKYFEPSREFSWSELNTITSADHRYWTWPLAMLLWLVQNNYDVKVLDMFDYDEFAEKGAKYIYEQQGVEVGEAQEKNSNIPLEQERARLLIGKLNKRHTIPTQEDIIKLLDEGYIPLCRVNSAALNGHAGYYGHSIVVTGYTVEGLIIHDPGLPPLENRHVAKADFETAWAYPVQEAKNVTAIKLVGAKHIR